ncbi:MAG: Ig-like domain-containing protein, partial [Oscillospiraceae bacterium]|nr:Ig-like domain-containing protein [Oscillospiraceae bacterium]
RTYVPNAGIYDISVKGIKNGNGGISDVYLAKAEKDFYGPGDVAELIGKAEYIGEADTKTGVNISRQKFSFDRGEYVYIFVPSEKSKDLGTITDAGKVPARNYLSEIRLVPVLSFDTAKLTLSDDDNTVTTGTYLYPGVEAFDKKGNPCSLEYAVITYESDNTDVAEVDEKTGEIYTKRPGKAKITVTAEDDIAKVSDSVELTVISRGEQTLLPAEIKAGFPLVDVEVGETARLKVTDEVGNELGDGVEYSYAIADESVMTEKDGTFTAVKTGKTDITVKAALGGEVKETTVTAAVVGKNLFTRDGVRHGEFENSVFLNPNGDTEVDLSGGEVRAKTIWKATKDRVRDIYEFTHFKNVASEITGRRTSYIKAAVDDTSYEGITEDGDRTFRIETGTNTTYAPQLENGKIYEYTGFVKLENARTIPTIQIRHQIYKVSDGTEIGKDLIDIYPFSSATGDFPWSRFLVGPFCANWEEDVIARSKVQATSVDPIGYELSISHLALREVEFEYVDFKIEGYFEGAETYDKFITTAVPMSNTGHEIFVGNTGTEIKVNYSSSDPVVARVDDNGVITAVSDGDCEIYADITLGSVTRRGIIPVHLEGLEVMLGSIVATADCELNV